jgi:acyl carrier protein
MGRPLSSEVRRLLGSVLERPVGDSEGLSRASEPRWDSLKHVEIIFLLEDHFGVRFTAQDLEGLNDVDGIVRALEARHAT